MKNGCFTNALKAILYFYLGMAVFMIYVVAPLMLQTFRNSSSYKFVLKEVIKSDEVQKITGDVKFVRTSQFSVSDNSTTDMTMTLYGEKQKCKLYVRLEREESAWKVAHESVGVNGQWKDLVAPDELTKEE